MWSDSACPGLLPGPSHSVPLSPGPLLRLSVDPSSIRVLASLPHDYRARLHLRTGPSVHSRPHNYKFPGVIGARKPIEVSRQSWYSFKNQLGNTLYIIIMLLYYNTFHMTRQNSEPMRSNKFREGMQKSQWCTPQPGYVQKQCIMA